MSNKNDRITEVKKEHGDRAWNVDISPKRIGQGSDFVWMFDTAKKADQFYNLAFVQGYDPKWASYMVNKYNKTA